MKLVNKFLSNFFKRKPRTPNEFVKKFVTDARKERAQLELIYNKEVIVQVDSLKFVPSWFKITNKSENVYTNGYVIFFVKEKKNYENNFKHKYLHNLKEFDLIKVNETHNNQDVITIGKFVPEIEDHISLAIEMKKFIDIFYSFNETNPSIIFNIRYLTDVPG